MALPASENTVGAKQCYIQKEDVDVITITAAADITQGDFVIAGPWGGVALEDIANGDEGSLQIDDEMEVQTADLKAGEDTFDTFGQKVFFDTATNQFSDTSTAGYYHVGDLLKVKDANAVIVFRTRPFVEVV